MLDFTISTVSSIPSVRQKKTYRLMKKWNYPNMEINIFIENKTNPRNCKWTNHSKKKCQHISSKCILYINNEYIETKMKTKAPLTNIQTEREQSLLEKLIAQSSTNTPIHRGWSPLDSLLYLQICMYVLIYTLNNFYIICSN